MFAGAFSTKNVYSQLQKKITHDPASIVSQFTNFGNEVAAAGLPTGGHTWRPTHFKINTWWGPVYLPLEEKFYQILNSPEYCQYSYSPQNHIRYMPRKPIYVVNGTKINCDSIQISAWTKKRLCLTASFYRDGRPIMYGTLQVYV